MSVELIADIAGMSREQAVLAKDREFTEPFRILKEINLEKIEKIAITNGIHVTRGGRFYHFIGAFQDKGKSVKTVTDVFCDNLGGEWITVGLGDSPNDLPMLKNVDIPVLIPHPGNMYEDIDLPNLRKAEQPGSKGWNVIIMEILDELTGTGS